MNTLERVEWEPSLLEPRRDRALTALVRAESGIVPPLLDFLSDCPWLARSTAALAPFRIGLREVPARLGDEISLVVSQDNSCRYCYATMRMLLRARGYPLPRVLGLEEDLLGVGRAPREHEALEFARKLSRASPPPGAADRARLRAAGWSENGVCEIAFLAGFDVYLNRISTLLALPVESLERRAEHWIWSWIAPASARVVQRFYWRGATEPLPADASSRPFAGVIASLGPLPAAAQLRRVIDGALASKLLSPRASALVFAAIARGLACAHAERESVALLEAQGVAPARTAELLANLGGPDLDAIEAACLPFARETIRYEPARIQRRARELATLLPRGAFLELVGIASLANMLCRIWLALEGP